MRETEPKPPASRPGHRCGLCPCDLSCSRRRAFATQGRTEHRTADPLPATSVSQNPARARRFAGRWHHRKANDAFRAATNLRSLKSVYAAPAASVFVAKSLGSFLRGKQLRQFFFVEAGQPQNQIKILQSRSSKPSRSSFHSAHVTDRFTISRNAFTCASLHTSHTITGISLIASLRAAFSRRWPSTTSPLLRVRVPGS
jgi:hypothetical protein